MEKLRAAGKKARLLREEKKTMNTTLLLQLDEQQQKVIKQENEIKDMKDTILGVHNTSVLTTTNHEMMISGLEKTINTCKQEFTIITQVNNNLESKVDCINEKILLFEKTMSEMNNTIVDQKNKIDNLESNLQLIQTELSDEKNVTKTLITKIDAYKEFNDKIVDGFKIFARGYGIIGLDPRTITEDDVIESMTIVRDLINDCNEQISDDVISNIADESMLSDNDEYVVPFELPSLKSISVIEKVEDIPNVETVDTIEKVTIEEESEQEELTSVSDILTSDNESVKSEQANEKEENPKILNNCDKCRILPLDRFEMLIKMSLLDQLDDYDDNTTLYLRWYHSADPRLIKKLLDNNILKEHFCNFDSVGYRVYDNQVYVGNDTYALSDGRKGSMLRLMKKKGLLNKKKVQFENVEINGNKSSDDELTKNIKPIINNERSESIFKSYEDELNDDIYDLDEIDFDNPNKGEPEPISTYEIRSNDKLTIDDVNEMLGDIIATSNVDTIIEYNNAIRDSEIEHPLYRNPESFQNVSFRIVKHELDDENFKVISLKEIGIQIMNYVMEAYNLQSRPTKFVLKQMVHGAYQIKHINDDVIICHNPLYYLFKELIGYVDGQKLCVENLSDTSIPISSFKQFLKRTYYGIILSEAIFIKAYENVINDYGIIRNDKSKNEDYRKDIHYFHDQVFGTVSPYNIRLFRKIDTKFIRQTKTSAIFSPTAIRQTIDNIRNSGVNFPKPSQSEYNLIKKGIGHIRIRPTCLYPIEKPIDEIIVPAKFVLEKTINLGQVTKYNKSDVYNISGIYTWKVFNKKTTKEMLVSKEDLNFDITFDDLDQYYEYIAKVRNLKSQGMVIESKIGEDILTLNGREVKISTAKHDVLRTINYDIAGLSEVKCSKYDVGFRGSHVFAKDNAYRAVIPHI